MGRKIHKVEQIIPKLREAEVFIAMTRPPRMPPICISVDLASLMPAPTFHHGNRCWNATDKHELKRIDGK